MSRKVMIDANVITHLNKGSEKAAKAMRSLLKSGATVVISRQAYNELTSQPGKMVGGVGPDLPRTAAANKRLLSDLGIKIAPKGNFKARGDVYAKNGPLSREDVLVAAHAKAANAELWSFDRAIRKDPGNVSKSLGVKVAPESYQAYETPSGKADYRKARKLMRLAPVEITVSGNTVKKVKGNKSAGGRSPRKPTQAVVGVPDRRPGFSKPTESRGSRVGKGIELGLQGVNFVVQKINDAVQGRRLKAAWKSLKPTVEMRLAKDPALGALIMVRYGKRAKKGGESESPLQHVNMFLSIEVAYGVTASEAWEIHILKPRMRNGAGLDVRYETSFIPPKRPVDFSTFLTPSRKLGLATFVPGRESLTKVSWDGIIGFDDVKTVKLKVPQGLAARFFVLVPPTKVTWRNGSMQDESNVDLTWADVGGTAPGLTTSVLVVDLDSSWLSWGDDTAALVFPADLETAALFGTAPETKDNNGQLQNLVNFKMVRWCPPQNLYMLRNFDDEAINGRKAS